MGLDTTHDCWHGPYSSFMRWRGGLHNLLTEGREPNTPQALEAVRAHEAAQQSSAEMPA